MEFANPKVEARCLRVSERRVIPLMPEKGASAEVTVTIILSRWVCAE